MYKIILILTGFLLLALTACSRPEPPRGWGRSPFSARNPRDRFMFEGISENLGNALSVFRRQGRLNPREWTGSET